MVPSWLHPLVCLQGFYAVFRQVFEDIAAEDKEYVDDPENFEVPGFGDSSSAYDEVSGEHNNGLVWYWGMFSASTMEIPLPCFKTTIHVSV